MEIEYLYLTKIVPGRTVRIAVNKVASPLKTEPKSSCFVSHTFD